MPFAFVPNPTPECVELDNANQIHSRLLQLPVKIRVKIWEYALQHDRRLNLVTKRLQPHFHMLSSFVTDPLGLYKDVVYTLALLYVSRIIYEEAKDILFKVNGFKGHHRIPIVDAEERRRAFVGQPSKAMPMTHYH